MFTGLPDLVFHPDAFFERVSREKVNLLLPVAIVGAGAIVILLPGIFAILYLSLTGRGNIGYVGWMGMLQFYFRSVFCLPLITWAAMSLGTYGISRMLDGKGTLALTVQNTGYGMMPWTISGIGLTVFSGILLLAANIFPADTMSIGEFASNAYWFSMFLSVAIFFWQCYLWVLAVRHTHGFSVARALGVTILPAIILVWLTTPLMIFVK